MRDRPTAWQHDWELLQPGPGQHPARRGPTAHPPEGHDAFAISIISDRNTALKVKLESGNAGGDLRRNQRDRKLL
jgi:hypothetical protein